MKIKSIFRLMFCFALVISAFKLSAQGNFTITANGPTDVCAQGTSLMLSIVNPDPNFTYFWLYENYSGYSGSCTPTTQSLGQGYSVSIFDPFDPFYGGAILVYCQAFDQLGNFIMDSNPLFIRPGNAKVPVCIFETNCGSSQLQTPYGVWSGATTWYKNGAQVYFSTTNNTYTASQSGYYSCKVLTNCGYAYSDSFYVSVQTLPSAIITPAGATTFCSGESLVLNAPVQANRSYQWLKGGTNIPGATLSSYTATSGGTYKVKVTNTATGCSKTSAAGTIVTVNALPVATVTPQGSTTFCAGGSVVLKANSGTGLTYKWKKTGAYISGATLLNYTATTAGAYRVQVTNSNSCSKTSAGVAVIVPCREDGIENESLNSTFDVNVYPNPSSGEFTLEYSNLNKEKFSVSIYDIAGRMIFKEADFTNSNNLTFGKDFLSGIYFAEISKSDKMKKIKLIKTK